jgi:hypothetical protein
MFWLETRVVMRGIVAGQPNGRQLVGLTAWCGVTVSVMWGKVVKKKMGERWVRVANIKDVEISMLA